MLTVTARPDRMLDVVVTDDDGTVLVSCRLTPIELDGLAGLDGSDAAEIASAVRRVLSGRS